MDRLIDILKAEGRAITEEFQLASRQGEGTPQEIADFREHALQSFIARFLPQNHIVSKGKITDLDGNQSNSIDCVILNPAHPNLIDSQGKFRLIFADGCDAAIEVKPDLARIDELHRALEQCLSVKRVLRSQSPILMPSKNEHHVLQHSLRVPFFVFAVKAFDPVKLYTEIAAYYSEQEVAIESQVDALFINGVGVVKNMKHPELNTYGADPPVGKSKGWYFEAWSDATCLGLLQSLESSFSSVPQMSASIMSRVLRKIAKTTISRLGDSV